MNKKYNATFLVFIIILSLLATIQSSIPSVLATVPVQPTQTNSKTKILGNMELPEILTLNWTRFWQLFNAHTLWDLEYYNGSDWVSTKSDMKVIKTYTSPWNCKFTLNFTASHNANYRLSFAIDVRVKDYVYKEAEYRYVLSYDEYNVTFNWSDVAQINGIVITHGMTNLAGNNYFWWRARRDNVPLGAKVTIDPTFGYETEESIGYPINDYIHGSVFTMPDNGQAESITAYVSSYGNVTVKGAIYRHDNLSLVASTNEKTLVMETSWATFYFSSLIPLWAGTEYILVLWANSTEVCGLAYTTGDTNQGHRQALVYNDFPDPLDPTHSDTKYCIYCEYLLSGPPTYTGSEPVFECAMNNMFELNGILEGNDTYRQMLLDSSPYENHGKIYPLTHPYAGPSITWGVMGKALQFDGIDDTVIVPSSDSLNVTEAITVEFWFCSYNVTPLQKIIDKYLQYVVQIQDGYLSTAIRTASGIDYWGTINQTITENSFYFFSFTYDYRDGYYTIFLHAKPYLNVTTDGFPIQSQNTNLYLGSLLDSTYFFDGVIDEIRIFPYKKSEDAIYVDATTSISKLGSVAFVNNGLSDDGYNWTVTTGTTTNYQGFSSNDPVLPWAHADDTHPYSFIRTINYMAGFQSFQVQCTLKFNQTYSGEIPSIANNYVSWYWNFFRDGRLQVTYDLKVSPQYWTVSGTEGVGAWEVRFRRTNPYFETEDMMYWYLITDRDYNPCTLPIIVSAWVGPDNKHFSMRFELQDNQSYTSIYPSNASLPFTYSFDLVDENLNPHITDWFDGWVVAGIHTRAHSTVGYEARMEIESHKLFWFFVVAFIIIATSQIIIHVLKSGIPGTMQTSATNPELASTAQIISQGGLVKTGDPIVDAISGLSHLIAGKLSDVATYIGASLKPLLDVFGTVGSLVVNAFINFMSPIISAIVNVFMSLLQTFINLMDVIFSALGWHNGFSQILNFINNFFTWVATSIPMVVTVITNVFVFVTGAFVTMISLFTSFVGNLGSIWTFLNWIWTSSLPYWGWIPNVIQSIWLLLVFFGIFWIISPMFEQRSLQAGFEGVKSRIDLTIGTIVKVGMFLWKVVDFLIDTLYRLIRVIEII